MQHTHIGLCNILSLHSLSSHLDVILTTPPLLLYLPHKTRLTLLMLAIELSLFTREVHVQWWKIEDSQVSAKVFHLVDTVHSGETRKWLDLYFWGPGDAGWKAWGGRCPDRDRLLFLSLLKASSDG